MKDLKNYLSQKINEDRFTGYSLSVSKEGKKVRSLSDGYATLVPEKIEAKENTIYDLASITKPVATSLLIAILYQNKLVDFNTPIKSYFKKLPDEKKNITVLQLLTHSSGIIPWKPLYYKSKGFENILENALNAEMEDEPGKRVIYSCINYVILKGIIEKVTQDSYENLFNKLIKGKLGLKNTFFSPPKELKEKISATEDGNKYERASSKKLFGINIPEREGVIWGEVHDGNSFYSGGTAGNAGLFSTAEETAILGQQFLKNYSSLLEPEIAELFLKDFTSFSPIRRSIGLILPDTDTSVISSPPFSKKAGYHNGFTGTSLAIDSDKNIVIAFLSNRVHPYVREELPKDVFTYVYTYILRELNV